MSIKACVFGLLTVGVIAAVVDSNTNEETPRPSRMVQKPMVAKKQTSRNYSSNRGTRNFSVNTTNGTMPNLPMPDFDPIPDMFPPDIPDPVEPFRFPTIPTSPCGPGGCPRR